MKPGPVPEAMGPDNADEPAEQGSALTLPTYRRLAEDGVMVTQCPPRQCAGYGINVFDFDRPAPSRRSNNG